jgi:hypothetical protein
MKIVYFCMVEVHMAQNSWRILFKFLLKTSAFYVAVRQDVTFADSLRTEATFRTVFVNAGYSAAFGAAAGAAMLPFFPEPALSNLRYVAAGASIGFVVGSAVAFYRLSQGSALYSISPTHSGEFESHDQDTDSQGEMYSQGDRAYESSFNDENNAQDWAGALIVGRGKSFGIGVPNIAIFPNYNGDFSKISMAQATVINWKF